MDAICYLTKPFILWTRQEYCDIFGIEKYHSIRYFFIKEVNNYMITRCHIETEGELHLKGNITMVGYFEGQSTFSKCHSLVYLLHDLQSHRIFNLITENKRAPLIVNPHFQKVQYSRSENDPKAFLQYEV